MPTCTVATCSRAPEARGLCHAHLLRLLRTGDVRADQPIRVRRRPRRAPAAVAAGAGGGRGRSSRRLDDAHVAATRPPCRISGCGRDVYARQLCRAHYRRLVVDGDVREDVPLKVRAGRGSLSHGYRKVVVAPHERWLVSGETNAPEHRLVLARALGRPLAPDESVHHRNGDRLDNRLANLELWSRWQPSGQRVEDKVTWAAELLARYAPDLLRGTGGEGSRGCTPDRI